MSLPYPYCPGRSASVFRGGRTTWSVGDGIPTEDRGNESRRALLLCVGSL